MNCIYKVGNKEFETLEQFKSFVRENGFSALGLEDLSREAALIVDKFTPKGESVMEMVARLNFKRDNPGEELPVLDAPTVEKLAYPSGQLTDYLTQSKIHRNTYSGVRLTGISANTGKMGGYMFESTPISLLRDKDVVFRPTTAKLKEYGVSSINELLSKNKDISVEEREAPTLKEEYHFRFGDKVYPKLTRLEDKGDNIFELIDMIINLAIDNVKEQKLFILGVTNSNANAFLTAITLGINLNDIVRLFTTPSIVALSSSKRLTPAVYEELKKDSLKTIAESSKTVETLLEEYFGGNIPTTLRNKITKELTKTNSKGIGAVLDLLTPSNEVLELIYTNEASKELKALSDYLVARELSKLSSIGEEYFVYSQLFSILRSLPASKARIDYLVAKIQEYSQFTYLTGTEMVVQARVLDNYKDLVKESELYQNLLETDPGEAEALLNNSIVALEKNPLFASTTRSRSKQWLNNRIMRRQAPLHLTPTGKSAFTNVTPLKEVLASRAYAKVTFVVSLLLSKFIHTLRKARKEVRW